MAREFPKGKKAIAKIRKFVASYCADPAKNGTKAALAAGCPEASAANQAGRWIKMPQVQEMIEKNTKKVEDRHEGLADRVIEEFKKLGFSNLQDFSNEDGSIKDAKDWPAGAAGAVASLEVDELFEPKENGRGMKQVGFTKKIKLWPKNNALENLGKIVKLIIDRKEVTGKDGAPLIPKGPDLSNVKLAVIEALAEGKE